MSDSKRFRCPRGLGDRALPICTPYRDTPKLGIHQCDGCSRRAFRHFGMVGSASLF
jgi:hypothetical protein